MATFDTDVIISVYRSFNDTRIGVNSTYAENAAAATGNTISGFKWDRRTWPLDKDFYTNEVVPHLWDPGLSVIPEEYFQSGYGSNKDLLMVDLQEVIHDDGINWSPIVNHGYFYTQKDEFYLFCDGYVTNTLEDANQSAGEHYIDLEYTPKPTIPILIRQYSFDPAEGRHRVIKNLRKVVEFTDVGLDEFKLDTSFSPPRLILNGLFTEQIGVPVGGTSGTPDTADIAQLEIVGISTGTANQIFSTAASPLDPSYTIEVWTWNNAAMAIKWTVITGETQFSGSANEVHIDYDLGELTFGSWDGSTGDGAIPTSGHSIGVTYTSTLSAQYEPDFTNDYSLFHDSDANINPLSSGSSVGFVQISSAISDPASIILSSTLPKINPYIISLGNNVGTLEAEVRSQTGALIDGEEVTFEITGPLLGSFGGVSSTALSVTNNIGIASTIYNAPPTVNQQGNGTVNVIHDGADTVVTFDGLIEPGDLSTLVIYKVHTEDDVLGVPESTIDTYYQDYFTEEGIEVNPDGTAPTTEFEEDYRTVTGIALPTKYDDATDFLTGKKTVILTSKVGGDVVDTETGLQSDTVLTPLTPDSVSNIGTADAPVLEARYNGINLPLPGTGDTRSYFGIGDAQTRIRAYVTNKRTGQKIYSNYIEMRVILPGTISGVFFADLLSEIPSDLLTTIKDMSTVAQAKRESTQNVQSFANAYEREKLWDYASSTYETYDEWFLRTQQANVSGLLSAADELADPDLKALNTVSTTVAPAEIPLGFRLKSSGITVASILDQVTFLDPNSDLPSDYYDVDDY